MALPFSNTTLRIPRGFGNLLEGLAKEVLRDQPEDIPVFAALYFSKLLKAREESGLDPAEWGARLEDRYYNNHAFKETTNDEGSGSLEEKRNKADHADPFESNGPQLSVLNETSTDFAGNIDVEQDHTLERSLDLESGETELRPAGNIPDAGTADVDVCAEELNNPAEAPEQTAEMTEIPNEVSEEYTDADICTSELDLKLQPTCGGLAEIEHLEVDGPPETPERKAESPFLVEEESESQDMPCIDNDQVVGEENVDDHTEDLETTGTSLQTTGLEDDDTIQDHAEESAESENEGENDRETDNPNSLLVEEEESESQDMSCIDNDQVVDDTSKENVDDHTEDLETTGTSLQTTGLEEDDTMQDHAEESAESENEGENDRETDSPNYFLVEEEESESQDMSCIHYDQVVDDTLKENVEDHTEDLETTATSLQTTGLEEDDTMQDHVEESSESENEGENEIKETNKSATAEAGEKAEGNGNLRHMEEQEESDHQNDSSNTVGQDESRSNSRSLLEIKEDYSETYDSKSEVIDVLDEVYNQSSSNTHEDSIVDQSSSVKVDDELSGSDGPNPCIEKNDSDTEITEEPTNKEISLTDAIDTSEKDLNTEDEGSDLESDLDILNLRDAVKSNEESDETHEIQLKEGILLPETEDVDHTPLSAEEAEVITEQHPAESQEHTENAETEADQEDQLESQRDKSQESALESEKQELSESQKSKEKCSEPQEEEDIMDIPLDDPEANKAAAKIQAGFRGHMTRKKMKPDEKPGEEVSSSGEGLNGNQVNSAGGADGETDATSGPEQ